MQKNADILFLENKDIDKQRWDECINKAHNSRIYGLSIYLDSMCSNWAALVSKDYKVVMPLPWKKKFGIYYLYQPAFCQQLGVFAEPLLTEEMVAAFLSAIPKKFFYWDIALNSANTVTSYNTRAGKNYLFLLGDTYDNLYKNYNRNAKRNIKKAREAGIQVCENISADTVISLHRKRFKDNVGANEKDYNKFSLLLNYLSENGQAYSIGAMDKDNVVIASSIYLLHNKRLVFIINGNLPAGLDNGSTYLLKDFAINKFSNQQIIMDFEGSDNIQFARFYQQFGAKEIEYYPFIINNNLPWPLRYFKKSVPFV